MVRLSLRRVGTALAATLALLVVLIGVQMGPAAAGAAEGAGWLTQQIGSKGYIEGQTGAPDGTNTAYAVLALYSAGQSQQAKPAVRWLLEHVDDVANAGGTDNPASLAVLIMALRAAGQDVHDRITRLQKTQVTSGPDAGLFGDADPTFDGATRQGLALLALATAGLKNAPGAAWLAKQQCADGSWQSYRSNLSKPCAPPDPGRGRGSDTNSTAWAYQGLKASAVMPVRDPLAWLTTQETADAGWSFYGGTGTAADANSTALATQAIIASGGDPDAPPWARPNATPPSMLDHFQLPDGSYAGAAGGQASVLATVQAVPAAAGKVFPLSPAATPLVDNSGGSSGLQVVLIVLVVLAAGAGGTALVIRNRRLKPAT